MAALIINGLEIPITEARRRVLPAVADRSRGLDNSLRISASAGTDQNEWEFTTWWMTSTSADVLEEALLSTAAATAEGDAIGSTAVLCRGEIRDVSFDYLSSEPKRRFSFVLHQASATLSDGGGTPDAPTGLTITELGTPDAPTNLTITQVI